MITETKSKHWVINQRHLRKFKNHFVHTWERHRVSHKNPEYQSGHNFDLKQVFGNINNRHLRK